MPALKLDRVYKALDKLKTAEEIAEAYEGVRQFLTNKLT